MRILKAESRGLADDDVAAKAQAQNGREPLKNQLDNEPTKVVVDPVERVRDN